MDALSMSPPRAAGCRRGSSRRPPVRGAHRVNGGVLRGLAPAARVRRRSEVRRSRTAEHGIKTNGTSRSRVAQFAGFTRTEHRSDGFSRGYTTRCWVQHQAPSHQAPSTKHRHTSCTSNSTPPPRFLFWTARLFPRRSSSARRRWAIPRSPCSIGTASTARRASTLRRRRRASRRSSARS